MSALRLVKDLLSPLCEELLTQIYSEYVLCSSITVWFGSASKSDIRRLQRTVRTAQRIIGAPLPNLQDLYISRVRKRAGKITLDPSHPQHTSSLNCCPLAGAEQPDTRSVLSPGPYPTWTKHNTPHDCTSVNNSVKLSSVNTTYAHSQFCQLTFLFSILYYDILICNLFSSLYY